MTERAWLVVALAGIGTWGMRASLVLLLGRVQVPDVVERSFRYVAPSVMAAISVPAFIAPGGTVTFSPPHLAAAGAAGLLAWRTGSFLATLAAGLTVFTVLSMLS